MTAFTRITIDLEPMSELDSGALGLWLDMMLREETKHTVHKLTVKDVEES